MTMTSLVILSYSRRAKWLSQKTKQYGLRYGEDRVRKKKKALFLLEKGTLLFL